MLTPTLRQSHLCRVPMTLLCMAIMTACSASQAPTNSSGTYSALVSATPAQVIAAADHAVQEMDLARVSKDSSDVDGELIARTPEDAPVIVTVFTEGEGVSKLNVRVGLNGNAVMSTAIIDRIKVALGAPVSTVAAAPKQ